MVENCAILCPNCIVWGFSAIAPRSDACLQRCFWFTWRPSGWCLWCGHNSVDLGLLWMVEGRLKVWVFFDCGKLAQLGRFNLLQSLLKCLKFMLRCHSQDSKGTAANSLDPGSLNLFHGLSWILMSGLKYFLKSWLQWFQMFQSWFLGYKIKVVQ